MAWLELVRSRARNTPAAPYHAADKVAGVPVKITTANKDELRLIIQNERRIEFGLEVEPKHKLMPIPDVEIRTSGNTLIQNEGY